MAQSPHRQRKANPFESGNTGLRIPPHPHPLLQWGRGIKKQEGCPKSRYPIGRCRAFLPSYLLVTSLWLVTHCSRGSASTPHRTTIVEGNKGTWPTRLRQGYVGQASGHGTEINFFRVARSQSLRDCPGREATRGIPLKSQPAPAVAVVLPPSPDAIPMEAWASKTWVPKLELGDQR